MAKIQGIKVSPKKWEEYKKILIVGNAMHIALRKNYMEITLGDLAKMGGVSLNYIYLRFKRIDDIRDAVMKSAIKNEILPVLAQGLAMGHPIALKAPKCLKEKAIVNIFIRRTYPKIKICNALKNESRVSLRKRTADDQPNIRNWKL